MNKNIRENKPSRKCNLLIVFDDMNADLITNKKLNPMVIDLFVRGRKLNISLVCITQSYFGVSKILA